MLAYVFWHWKYPEITNSDYEDRQRGFHAALGRSRPEGFIDSLSSAISNAPWTTSHEAYEDWYLVQDFAALGLLNEGAVSGARAQPHDVAAAVAAGGVAGVYGLRHGNALRRPRYATWFAKPDGMTYRDLFAEFAPVVDRAEGALWMRQMVLGPATEFCLHTTGPVSLPGALDALVIPLRQTWPDLT